VSVVKLCLYVSECVCSKIIKELPGLVGSGTPCIRGQSTYVCSSQQPSIILFYMRHPVVICNCQVRKRVRRSWL